MEQDFYCDKNELILCTYCNLFLCKAHKEAHAQNNKGIHQIGLHEFKEIGEWLYFTQIFKIVEIISFQIYVVDECKFKSLRLDLLQLIKNNAKELESLLNRFRSVNESEQEGGGRSRSEYLVLIKNIIKISSMKLEIATNLLADDYKLLIGGHTKRVKCIAITNDSKYIVSGSEDMTIRIWEFQTKRLLAILLGHTDSVVSLKLTMDNQFIISGGDTTVRIWNLKEMLQETVLERSTSRPTIPLY